MNQIDMGTDQRAVPDTVTKAAKLMLVGAALALVQIPVWAAINHDPAVVAYDIAAGVVEAGVWWLVARACRQGRKGGRVLASVFFGLATIAQLPAASGRLHLNPVLALINALSWLVGLGAVVMLWHRDSADYFRPRY